MTRSPTRALNSRAEALEHGAEFREMEDAVVHAYRWNVVTPVTTLALANWAALLLPHLLVIRTAVVLTFVLAFLNPNPLVTARNLDLAANTNGLVVTLLVRHGDVHALAVRVTDATALLLAHLIRTRLVDAELLDDVAARAETVAALSDLSETDGPRSVGGGGDGDGQKGQDGREEKDDGELHIALRCGSAL